MHWLFAARRLKQLGILGMNHRNAACILDHNPRHLFPIVDDKRRMRNLCARIGVATPEIYCAVDSHSALRRLPELLGDRCDFVIKPNRGSGGRGILVVTGKDGDAFVRHNGERLRPEQIRQHLSDILSGMYSLGGRPDAALLQQRVRLHPAFERISFKGIPDIRVILYRNEPAMAMLRLPTQASNGRANLHQGGIGTGVDLDTGRTNHAVQRNRAWSSTPGYGRAAGWHEGAVLAAGLGNGLAGGGGGWARLPRRGYRRGCPAGADAAGGECPAGFGDPDCQWLRATAATGGDRCPDGKQSILARRRKDRRGVGNAVGSCGSA